MSQRARFLSAIKFFARGNQAQFKFAFEGKKSTESDYNAFMRLNAHKGVYITKGQGENPAYPMVGNFICSKGSLPEIVPYMSAKTITGDMAYMGIPTSLSSGNAKVSDLSVQLMNYLNVPAGTILTFFAIQQIESVISDDGYITVPATARPVQWDIKQFRLDPNDTRDLEEIGFEILDQDNLVTPGFVVNKWYGKSYAAVGIIASREENGTLKVSNCTLQLNQSSKVAWARGIESSYMYGVLADWGAADKAVLQGGLLTEQTAGE